MAVYISSGAFQGVRTVEELLPVCRENGLYEIELASGLRVGSGDGYLPLIKPLQEEFRFLMHNYFPAPEEPFVLNLADRDEANRLRSIRFCIDALEGSVAMGIPFYSIHAGFVSSLRPEDLGRPERQQSEITAEDYALALNRFSESVMSLAVDARRLGVRLLLENNVDAVSRPGHSHLLLVSGEDVEQFFSQGIPSEIGMLLDVAHLRVSAKCHEFDPVDAVEKMAPWIGALHLSDNDGLRDSNAICEPDSWFWEPLQSNCGKDTVTVLEAYRLAPEVIHAQRELITRKLSFAV